MLSCQLVTMQVGIEHPHVGLDSGKRRILLTAWKLRFQIFFVRSPFQAIAGLWQPGLRYGTVHLLFCNQMSFRPGVRGPRSSRSVSI